MKYRDHFNIYVRCVSPCFWDMVTTRCMLKGVWHSPGDCLLYYTTFTVIQPDEALHIFPRFVIRDVFYELRKWPSPYSSSSLHSYIWSCFGLVCFFSRRTAPPEFAEGFGSRPPLLGSFAAVVLVHVWVRFLCSHQTKRTAPREKTYLS